MKQLSIIIMAAIMLVGCAKNTNPFFEAYTNEYGAPPFDKIKVEHYMPAFLEGIKQQQAEIDAIANSTEAPTFDNVIAAIDFSGELLTKVSNVFFGLYAAESNDEMAKIATEVSPLLTEHGDNLYLNEKIFEKVKSLYEARESLGLNPEQLILLEKYYKNFVRSGAALSADDKAKLREINKEIGVLQLTYGQNILAETNSYKRYVDNEADLAGLPQSVITAAKEDAKKDGQEGKWLFTTHKTSFIPVLQYAENRPLRKDLLLAYYNRANNGNANDNKAVINKLMQLRVQRAQMLGFNTPSDFILDNTMAKDTKTVMDFLNTLWEPTKKKMYEEAAELQKMMDAEGKGEKLEAWDWWYYTEKLRKAKYDLDEEQVRPYFKLENVRKGAFDLCTRLWGITFEPIANFPVYHAEVEAFKVTDADGSHIGILYTDYYPRAGKRGGAWMGSYLKQSIPNGVNVRPIITNVGNFTKPTADKPSLMSMDEVETLFHELGHALHGLLSQVTYPSISGTSVPRDFVELPSQIMENWVFEPEVLKTYAFHYETGEVIPNELIEKIQQTATFNQGFIMGEFLAAAFLDMDYHTMSEVKDIDVEAFEKQSMERIGMIPAIFPRYTSTTYQHIFSGGYASGYYSYKWSEVLDADAYQAFVETGDIYNKEVATSFRKNVLEKGGSAEAMQMYINFRGKAPNADALLIKRGLK